MRVRKAFQPPISDMVREGQPRDRQSLLPHHHTVPPAAMLLSGAAAQHMHT